MVRFTRPFRGFANTDIKAQNAMVLYDRIQPAIAAGPPPPQSACGVVNFRWRSNTLSGPFWRSGATQNEFFCCGVDPANFQRVQVLGSADFGETWAPLDDTFPVLTNPIDSVESRQAGSSIVVATQERSVASGGTGRVAYSRFDMVTKTWAVKNAQVQATADVAGVAPTNTGVSIDVRQNGNVGVMYLTDDEVIMLMRFRRIGFRESSDDGATWSAQVDVGHWGQQISDALGRLQHSNLFNGFHFFYKHDPNIFFQNFDTQTLDAANLLTAINTWDTLVPDPPNSMCGRPVVYVEAGVDKVAIPYKRGPNLQVAVFVDSAAGLAAPVSVTQPNGGPFVVEDLSLAAYAQATLDFINTLQVVSETQDPLNPTWAYWEGGGPAGWAPTFANGRIGPFLPPSPSNVQHCNGLVILINGVKYVAVVIGNSNTQNLFQLSRAIDLPSANETVAQWLTRCT